MTFTPPPIPADREAMLDELALYLRPPGQGIHTVSTGREALEATTARYLGHDAAASPWRAHLARVLTLERTAPALMAIPSDTGAGLVRGANRGPEGIRAEFGAAPVDDLGDILTIPHLLGEDMLSESQRAACQHALYPDATHRGALPVSPLGMAERSVRLIRTLAPKLPLHTLGGDHTVSWPVVAALLDTDPAKNHDVGIVHFDAHTDLLPHRLGVDHCFATWAYHANERLGRGGRLVQIGIRVSGRDKAHWERTCDVRQYWAEEARRMGVEHVGARVVEDLRAAGVRRVYISNDIDGTDAHWAAACGTPEVEGLSPDLVEGVIAAVDAAGFAPLGADLVEVAPGLSLDADASARTLATAARYVRAQLAFLGQTRD